MIAGRAPRTASMTATPASHPFEIREHDAGGVHVIAMRGELDLATAPRLAVRIDGARRNGSRRLLVDLTTAEFCDSTGLRALFGCRQEIVAHGGRMVVAVARGQRGGADVRARGRARADAGLRRASTRRWPRSA